MPYDIFLETERLFLRRFTFVDLRDTGINDESLEKLVWGITGKKSEPPESKSPAACLAAR